MPGLILNPALFFRPTEDTNQHETMKLSNLFLCLGPRGEFWVWDTRLPSSGWAVRFYQAHLKVLANAGVNRLESVDVENKKILSSTIKMAPVWIVRSNYRMVEEAIDVLRIRIVSISYLGYFTIV